MRWLGGAGNPAVPLVCCVSFFTLLSCQSIFHWNCPMSSFRHQHPLLYGYFFLLPFSVDFLQLPNVNVLSTRTFVVLNIQTFHCPLIPWCLFTSFKSTCIPQFTFLNIALFSFASFSFPGFTVLTKKIRGLC